MLDRDDTIFHYAYRVEFVLQSAYSDLVPERQGRHIMKNTHPWRSESGL